MATPEQDPKPSKSSGEPFSPSVLSPDLAEFLRGRSRVALLHSTDQGSVFITKVLTSDVATLRGNLPISVRQELFEHPSAPVIRMVVRFYDRPKNPLALETFVNVQDPEQRTDFEVLSDQEDLLFLIYDDDVHHRLTKRVRNDLRQAVPTILSRADRFLAAISPERVDFDQAKADVMGQTSL